MTEPDEQPELLPGMVRATVKQSQAKARATRARKAAEQAITEVDPVARVLVDVPLAHLDRPFDYAVPESLAEAARPGSGSRCASPARTSTGTSWRAPPPPTTPVG